MVLPVQNSKITLGKTNQAILNGTEDVRLWSDEELLRGQRKAKNGRWTGRPPKVVPLKIHEELTRRRLSEACDLPTAARCRLVLSCRQVARGRGMGRIVVARGA